MDQVDIEDDGTADEGGDVSEEVEEQTTEEVEALQTEEEPEE